MIVLFEDNHILVVNKPAGLLTQPSGTDQLSLEKLAKEWLKQKYQKPGNVFLHAIHRLDKPVSGIVLFAKTSKALARLQEAMRNKKCKKIYTALVEGILKQDEGSLQHFLSHDEFSAKISPHETAEAKPAILHYKVLEKRKNATLVEIELETGRYHQIRAQMSAIGHPIIGDTKYGSSTPYNENAIALHHYQLTIPHPITSELLTFTADEHR